MAAEPTAEALYPKTLEALVTFLRALNDSVSAEYFEGALQAWLNDQEVAGHLEQKVARMGSLLDWILENPWHDACKDVLMWLSWDLAELIQSGRLKARPHAQEYLSEIWVGARSCGQCGERFFDDAAVERVAKWTWTRFAAEPRARGGDVEGLVGQALAAGNDPEITRHVQDAANAFARAGLSFLARRDACAIYGATDWQGVGLTVSAPPLRVGKGTDPLTWIARRRRQRFAANGLKIALGLGALALALRERSDRRDD